MSIHLHSRRGFLRGLGAAVTLPALEALHSPLQAAVGGSRPIATTATGAPLRMAYLYVPNGVNLEHWRPQGRGSSYQMGRSFKALEKHRDDFQIFTGFEQKNAAPGADGPGDHARANSVFLTSARPKKTAGSDIQLGISVDQLAANAVAAQTRLASLELSTSGVRKSGKCDSGYSCAYQFNLSWRSATQPMTPEASPRAVFERLFGAGKSQERKRSLAQRMAAKKSVLDFIHDDAKALHRHLGRTDQQKLDEYLTGVREIEKQIEKHESLGLPPDPGVPAPEQHANYEEHLKMMFDMMVLAFKTDSTRISSFMLAHDGSNRPFKEIGVNDGHHNISHHKRDPKQLEKIAKIDEFYLAQLAYFLERMKTTEDVDGNSLLHNSMIVYGSAIADGDRHNHDDLPILMAGNAGGAFEPGRHVDLGGDVPMANLYLRMLQEFGIKEQRFGDSTGVLNKI
ncbi:MAG: DUF1552 domain-containing protein [Akkermansiaceae bacterium]|nr:DUF1552 domain-containing protein [Akkermansiaceae bacterium]